MFLRPDPNGTDLSHSASCRAALQLFSTANKEYPTEEVKTRTFWTLYSAQISQCLLLLLPWTLEVPCHYHPIATNNPSDNGHFTRIYALGPLQCLAEYGPAIETLHKMESTAKSRENWLFSELRLQPVGAVLDMSALFSQRIVWQNNLRQNNWDTSL